MRALGAVITGVLTAAAGFPVMSEGKLSTEGLIVCVGATLLWIMTYELIRKAKK